MTTLALILAIIRAIPALKEVWDQLVAGYIAQEIKTIKKQYRDAIRKAIDEHDQRFIEEALGSTRTGEASGIPSADIVDELPNVRMRDSSKG